MGKEIERKFLLNLEVWHLTPKPKGLHFRQGYILTDPNKTIRIRATETKGFLTIKGKSVGASRLEYEYEIPLVEAVELLDHFSVAELEKLRYNIQYAGKLWEVDEFLGENKGLFVAEIELESEDEKFDLPLWVAEEVTADHRYFNSNLTSNPFKNWSDKAK